MKGENAGEHVNLKQQVHLQAGCASRGRAELSSHPSTPRGHSSPVFKPASLRALPSQAATLPLLQPFLFHSPFLPLSMFYNHYLHQHNSLRYT